MTGSFTLTVGTGMVITQGGRTVIDTAGRLASLLDTSHNFGTDASPASVTLTYPDVTKGWLYNWRWVNIYQPGTGGQTYDQAESGTSFVSAKAQDISSTTVLATVPAGCNLTAAKVRINRTTSPSHTWLGNTILVKPPTNQWISFMGSVLLEEQLGFCRAMSLYVNGSNQLIMHQQQSVSVPPSFTDAGAPEHVMPYSDGGGIGANLNGGEWAYDGTSIGLPVWQIAFGSVDHGNVTLGAPGQPNPIQNYRRTSSSHFVGPSAVSVTDPTNYHSIYNLDVVAQFGRAS